MASDETVQQCLQIIGEAISVEPEDFLDHETWKFLGLNGLLASATIADLRSQAGIDLSDDAFDKYPTVGAFKTFLSGERSGTGNETGNVILSPPNARSAPEPTDPWEGVPKPKMPLSIVLQGEPDECAKTVFLFPDGSGLGAAYGSLPFIGKDICLVGLNSPFLRQAEHYKCSIPRMAKLWLNEVRKLQPKGKPYILGGWSAGGFYAYEIAKLLTAMGEKVDRLILIDSPCRWIYTALPTQVVDELTRVGLMGSSGEKKAPDWLVKHFNSTVIAVDSYWPTPFTGETTPERVHFIWVKEGLVKNVAEAGLNVDMSLKITRFLLESRGDLRSEGWELLLPDARLTFDYMTGNHFQITQPPHSHNLGEVLRKTLAT